MTDDNDDFELIRGSGNVFHDFDMPDANILQAKAILTAKIIGILDDRELSTRAAERLTGYKHVEFSRIRNAKVQSFSIERLMSILGALDDTLEVLISVEPWQQPEGDAPIPELKG